jgi:hypothetical protein
MNEIDHFNIFVFYSGGVVVDVDHLLIFLGHPKKYKG